jgi:hypothetical protein
MVKAVFRKVKGIFKMVDGFSTPDLLRYKSSSDYSTAWGGFFTLVFMAAIFLTFSVEIINCFKRNQITASEAMVISQEPKLLQISTEPAANFMLSIQIEDLDLNGPKRYFDISMKKISFDYVNDTFGWD